MFVLTTITQEGYCKNMPEEVCSEVMSSLQTCLAENGNEKCADIISKLTDCCAANNVSTGGCDVNSLGA